MAFCKQARGRKRGGGSVRGRGNFVGTGGSGGLGLQQQQPRKKKTTTKLNINFEDTSCVICSREIKADPVTVVLQDKKRLDEILTVFCKVMRSDCPSKFDFRVEQFPFCRACGFLVEEMKEVHREFERLQVKLSRIKAKCAGKILETWEEPAAVAGIKMPCDGGPDEVGEQADKENKKIGNQTHAAKSKDKVHTIRRRIARRYQPRVVVQKLTEIAGIPLQWTNELATDFIECSKCRHRVPIPSSKFTGRRNQSSSGVYPVYDDEEIKSMLSDLVDCLNPSCSSCNTTITSDDGQTLSDCDSQQSASSLSDSLTDALIATRDAWIQDYLGQLFALNYENLSLWGSEAMDTVRAECGAVDTDVDFLDGETTSGMMTNNRPSNPRPLQICHHCNGGFKQRIALKRHLASIHGEGHIYLFNCNFCAKSYSTTRSVKGHLRQAHPLEPSVPLNNYFTKTIVTSDGIQEVKESETRTSSVTLNPAQIAEASRDHLRQTHPLDPPVPLKTYCRKTIVASGGIQKEVQESQKRTTSSITLNPAQIADISNNAKFNPVVKLATLKMDEILKS